MPGEQGPHQHAEGEGIAQASGPGATAISNIVRYEHVRPQPIDTTLLEEGRRLLDELPLDHVPEAAPPPTGSRGSPIDPNPLFVGREEDLKALAAQVKGGSAAGPVRTVCVSGIGGVGKTQLASEFTHRYGPYFRGGVYWLNLSNPSAAAEEIAGCGGAGAMDLRGEFDRLPLEDQVKAVKAAWLNELPRLIVLDNCEDASSLRACRPPTGGCCVLLTSRGVFVDPALAVAALELDILDRGQSVGLLRSRCPSVQLEEADLAAVAEELGDLPLALDLAGRFLYEYRDLISPSGYVKELRAVEPVDHPSLRRSEGYSPTDHELDVGRTFVVSYQRLAPGDATDRLAIRLLARAARFAPGKPIQRNLLLATIGDTNKTEEGPGEAPDAFRRVDALRRLTGLGLVGESEAGLVRMHRLVAASARLEVEDDGAQTSVERAVAMEAIEAVRSGQPVRLEPIMPHLRHAADVAGNRDDEPAYLVRFATGHALLALGYPAEAVPYLRSAVEHNAVRLRAAAGLTVRERDELLWLIMRQRNDVGVALERAGDSDGALALHELLLEDRRNNLPEPHEDVASTLINIGSLKAAQGLLHEVAPMYEEAIGIREAVLARMPTDHPERRQLLRDLAESHNNLGALSMDLGRLHEAANSYRRALDIHEGLEETEHERYADTTMRYGAVLGLLGDFEGARSRLESALCVHRRVLQEENTRIVKNLILLGALLAGEAEGGRGSTAAQRQKILEAARMHLGEALGYLGQGWGENHPLTAGVMWVAASVAEAEGHHADASSLRAKAGAIRRAVLRGADADFIGKGTEIFAARGLYDEAELYGRRALELRRSATAGGDLEVAEVEFALGRLLLLLGGRDAEAAQHLEEALTLREASLGRGDPATELVRDCLTYLRGREN